MSHRNTQQGETVRHNAYSGEENQGDMWGGEPEKANEQMKRMYLKQTKNGFS